MIANRRQWSLLFGNFSMVSHLTWCSVPPTLSTTVSLPTLISKKQKSVILRIAASRSRSRSIDWLCQHLNIKIVSSNLIFSLEKAESKRLCKNFLIVWCKNLTVVLLINILVPVVNAITVILSQHRIYFIYSALHHFSIIELKISVYSLLETPGFSWFDSYVI